MNDLFNPGQEVAGKEAGECRRWSVAEAEALFALPFSDLMFVAIVLSRSAITLALSRRIC